MKQNGRNHLVTSKKSIKRKVILQFSGLIAVAMLLMIFLVIHLVNQQMSRQTHALLQNKAESVQQRLEQRIRYLVENSELLTKNELMINALIDVEGRKTYLPPLVENFMEGKDVISLNVVDFDGRPIFQTQEDIPRYNESAQLRASLALGEMTLYIQKSDNQMVVIAPIKYYATTQGSVVVVFDLAAVANRNLPEDRVASLKLLKEDEPIYRHNVGSGEYRSYRLLPKPTTPYLGQLGITVEMGLPESVYSAPVKDALMRLALLGMAFILAGIVLSSVLAGTITEPIVELFRRVKKSSETEETVQCSPLGTDDELEELAKAFDERTQMLDYLNQNLQKEVDEHLEKIREQDQILVQQSKMALMGEMMSAISHQWRQPLNALALDIQDVREAYEFGELDKAYIDNNIKNSMEKIKFLSDTINNFRDYFKPQTEKGKFMVSEALKEAGAIIGEELEHHGIRLDMTGGDFEIDGFKKNLSQVFLNIMTNAKDAIDEKKADSPSYDGLISIRVDSGKREIVFEDNGGGIPEDTIDKVFNPYFSTKFAAQGIGIGLFMSKMIVEKHHSGLLGVENGKEGARFIIKL